jgi:cell division protease FtsH
MMIDFELAKDKVLMGAERKSMILSDAEKRNTAYHEAGHTLVAAMLPFADPLHKVSIIPRGMALGVTMQLPIDDKHSYSKDYLNDQLAILMGGRIAEEKFMNHMTTGAGNDIERATDLARKMVCEWGMSELGPLSFGKKEEQIFLGREIAQHREVKLIIDGIPLAPRAPKPKDAEDHTQQVIRPEGGRRVPGLAEGERPAPA